MYHEECMFLLWRDYNDCSCEWEWSMEKNITKYGDINESKDSD